MGWIGTHKPKGKSMRDFFAEEFNNDTDKGKITVIDCSARLCEAYLAMEVIKDKKRTVFAMVCAIIHSPKSYHNFTYKDMDESMEPFFYNCPERILDLLTPTENENAITWRNKCRLVIKQKKDRPKFKAGDTLVFEKPIEFCNGFKLKHLTCITKKPLSFRSGDQTYRISRRCFNENNFIIL